MFKRLNPNAVKPILIFLGVVLFITLWGVIDTDYANDIKAEQQYYHDEIFSNHVCSDTTHITCDGNCECDGLGCN